MKKLIPAILKTLLFSLAFIMFFGTNCAVQEYKVVISVTNWEYDDINDELCGYTYKRKITAI